jgi:hypothetical protein
MAIHERRTFVLQMDDKSDIPSREFQDLIYLDVIWRFRVYDGT